MTLSHWSDLRDEVLFRFNEFLCIDRSGYDERLDFFEIRFDCAVANLRRAARRKVLKDSNRLVTLTFDEETNEPSKEVEDALARLSGQNSGEDDTTDYRLRLLPAIDALPDDQRRVITLLLQGLPIDSQQKGVVTIARALGCSEKTVRNRRDRAFIALRAALEEEAVS